MNRSVSCTITACMLRLSELLDYPFSCYMCNTLVSLIFPASLCSSHALEVPPASELRWSPRMASSILFFFNKKNERKEERREERKEGVVGCRLEIHVLMCFTSRTTKTPARFAPRASFLTKVAVGRPSQVCAGVCLTFYNRCRKVLGVDRAILPLCCPASLSTRPICQLPVRVHRGHMTP